MLTKMIHRDHGQTYAYNRLEVESLEARGWSVAPPKELPVPVTESEAVAMLAHLGVPIQKKKPGPKPKAK